MISTDIRQLLAAAAGLGIYGLANRYAEPVADVLAIFCISWTASDITRRILGARSGTRHVEP